MKVKKVELNPIGLRQDEGVANFNAQYLFDAKNIRIEATTENSQTSITNERGTRIISVVDETEYDTYTEDNLLGIPIGYEVLDNDLVIFTTENTSTPVIPIDNNVIITLNDLSGVYSNSTLTINYSILGIKNYTKGIRNTLSIHIKVYSVTDGELTLHTFSQAVTSNYELLNITIPESADKIIITELQVSTLRNSVPFTLTKMEFPTYVLKNSGVFSLSNYANNYFPKYNSNVDSFENATTQTYSSNAGTINVINGTSAYFSDTSITRVYNNTKYQLGTYQYYAYDLRTSTLNSTSNRFIENSELGYLEREDINLTELYTFIEFTALKGFIPPVIVPLSIISYADNSSGIYVDETKTFKYYISPEDVSNKLVNISFDNIDLEVVGERTIQVIEGHYYNVFNVKCNGITDDVTILTASSDSHPEIFATYVIDKNTSPIGPVPLSIVAHDGNVTSMSVEQTAYFKYYISPEDVTNKLVNIAFSNEDLVLSTARTIEVIDEHYYNVFGVTCMSNTYKPYEPTSIIITSDSHPAVTATYVISKN